MFDSAFKPVTLSGTFSDPNIPAGYAPFGIQLLAGKLYVTYAQQDAAGEDDVGGSRQGLRGRLQHERPAREAADLPRRAQCAVGPGAGAARFRRFSNSLLVGNFGDGAIHAYDPATGALRGQLMNQDGNPILIDGLWALQFGNGVTGTTKTLLFTAGLADESHGLFGEITAHH